MKSRKAKIIAPSLPEPQGTNLKSWTEIKINPRWDEEYKKQTRRLNALGSSFTFAYDVLGYKRLTRELHDRFIFKELEQERLAKLIEFPRDHFKTTCATISQPMWRSLPFTEEDEKAMRLLGYGDEWIRWMKIAHNTCRRTLIASEVAKNARKWSDKIAHHYEANADFKYLFPEIIPKGKERWNKDSLMHQRINDGVYQSEGTYDFIGADGALQSNHYEGIIEDDVIGEEAATSSNPGVMEATIDWHKKLPGCFDSVPGKPDELGDQLVINNRWGRRDLSWHVRNKESRYTVIMHSAEGGCCEYHPPNQPIFPEEFSMKKLAMIRETEGEYNYSCHFLNNPTAPGATRFKPSWMRWYTRAPWEGNTLTPQNTANYQQLSASMKRVTIEQLDAQSGNTPKGIKMAMHHETRNGEVMDDVRAGSLDRIMIIDPSHSGEFGRSRNAILVLGIYAMRDKDGKMTAKRFYFLDGWAKECSYEEWIDAAIGERFHAPGLAWRWRIHRLYGEFNSDKPEGWHHTLKEKLKLRSSMFSLHDLVTDRSENAKHQRIIGMEAVYQAGAWWMPREGDGQKQFMDEFNDYPHGATIDLLDLAGYSPQTFGLESRAQQRMLQEQYQRRWRETSRQIGRAGY